MFFLAVVHTAGQMMASTKAGTTTSYAYAGTSSNELLSEATTGGDTYQYAYGRTDQNGLPEIEEVAYTHSGVTANAYVAHDNTGLPVLLTTSTGSACMYVYDGHNNPAGLVTNFGSLAYLLNFDPYGGATVAQNSGGSGYVDNPYTYAGGIGSHTTQLIKFGIRWYDPTTGTWTQQDTLNAPLDPHNGNRYTYAADNPINNADPAGTDWTADVFGGVVGVATFVGVSAYRRIGVSAYRRIGVSAYRRIGVSAYRRIGVSALTGCVACGAVAGTWVGTFAPAAATSMENSNDGSVDWGGSVRDATYATVFSLPSVYLAN